MQPVRKKQRHPARMRAVLIAGFALLILLAALLLLSGRNKPSLPPPEPSVREEITLIGKSQEDLAAFELFPTGHPSYRLVRAGAAFHLENKPDFPLDQQMLAEMAQDLTSLSAEKAGDINEISGGKEAIGIDGTHFYVNAEYKDGSRCTFSFGSAAYTEIPSDYLMISGDDSVYTVSPQIRSNLDLPLGALHPIPRINFSADLLDALYIRDGQDLFSLERKEDFWQVTSPCAYPADPGQIASLIKDISGMRLAVYVGEADELPLADYGLQPPSRTAAFHLAKSFIITQTEAGDAASLPVDAQRLEFSIGKDIDRIGFYCLYQGAVYQASHASMGFLTALSMDRMLAINPVAIPVSQLRSLRVRDSAGQIRQYQVELVEHVQKNNALAKDAQGRQLYDPLITLNGKAFDQEAFAKEYLKLMDLENRGRLPEGFVAEGSPVTQYTLSAGDTELDLAFYPYDALHLAMAVNGRVFFYVTRQSVLDIGL